MANLDPSIILGVKPYQQDDPLERYSKLAGLEANQLTIDKAREERADEQAVRQAYQQSGGDSTVLRRLLTEGGRYKQIQALDKADQDRRTAEATARQHMATAGKAEWEVRKGKAERGASLLAEAKDPTSFMGVVQTGVQEGTWDATQAQQMIQRGYSPEYVRQLQAGGLDFAKRMELEGQRETRAETNRANLAREGGVAAGQAETGRHNLVTEGAAATAVLPATVQAHAGATAAGRVAGEAQATAQVNLPKTIDTGNRAIRLIDEMVGSADGKTKPHPGFENAVGMPDFLTGGAVAGFIPGTSTSDFKARFEELQGGAFLQAFESLKGGGPITEIEGAKATAALTRMKLSQSEGEFVKAAREFQDSVRKMVEIHKARAAGGAPAPTPGAPTQSAATATGTGPTLRVPAQGQAAADNETAGMLAQTKTAQWLTENIANNTAALNDPRNKNMKSEHRTLIARELEAYKRALEIQRGGAGGARLNPANMSNAEIQRELNRQPPRRP